MKHRDAFLWPWLCAVFVMVAGPSYAVPKFARQYGVDCHQCHSVPPRLNQFGLAFQANYFNWPGAEPPPRNDHFKRFPISGIAEYSLEDNRTEDTTTAKFRELEFFLTDGFQVSRQRQGGFFLNTIGVTTEEKERDWGLENAFAALPVVGRRGQWALAFGQMTPLTFQWDPVNSLTDSLPAAISDQVNEFSFTEAMPGLRLDFFDHRGKRTSGHLATEDPENAREMAEMEYRGAADGSYLQVGMPFRGRLALNSDASLRGPLGPYLHAFHRRGYTTLGVFAFTHAGDHLEGLIGTHELRPNLYLLAAGAIGHDRRGSTRRLSLEADWVLTHMLAVTGRLEVLGGQRDEVAPALGVTYEPFEKPWMWLRLSAEVVQRKGERTFVLAARGMF
ncbi:MAG: hypothetical protein HY320_14560 [Armatimonadetes bacterium]|nr:hypothetical protein [Armatimonadota bacterium]